MTKNVVLNTLKASVTMSGRKINLRFSNLVLCILITSFTFLEAHTNQPSLGKISGKVEGIVPKGLLFVRAFHTAFGKTFQIGQAMLDSQNSFSIEIPSSMLSKIVHPAGGGPGKIIAYVMIGPMNPSNGVINVLYTSETKTKPFYNIGEITFHCAIGPQKNDVDEDGIQDSLENELAAKYSPVVYLHPNEDHYPSSVDWFLERSDLYYNGRLKLSGGKTINGKRMDQKNLRRESNSLISEIRQKRCSDRSYLRLKSSPNSQYHRGMSQLNAPTYVHFRRSKLVANGYEIQYWFFYPYNNGPVENERIVRRSDVLIAAICPVCTGNLVGGRIAVESFESIDDHEGDWEHISITVNAETEYSNPREAVHSIYFARHKDDSKRLKPQKLEFWDSDRPNEAHVIVYSALGSHASYERTGKWDLFSNIVHDHTETSDKIWFTQRNLINVGELRRVRNNQYFIYYSGLWGNKRKIRGIWSGTVGPACKEEW